MERITIPCYSKGSERGRGHIAGQGIPGCRPEALILGLTTRSGLPQQFTDPQNLVLLQFESLKMKWVILVAFERDLSKGGPAWRPGLVCLPQFPLQISPEIVLKDFPNVHNPCRVNLLQETTPGSQNSPSTVQIVSATHQV